MPPALREFYEVAGTAKRAFLINDLLAPDDIGTDSGHRVFPDTVLATLSRLDLPPWPWPGSPARWYAGEDAVAFTCPNIAPGEDAGGQPLSVWISAMSEEAIAFVEPYLGAAWDYYSPRDG
jgi:hypothetical protein